MTGSGLNLDLLIPSGRILLAGSFGYALILSLRGNQDMEVAFERLTVGFLALLFFRQASDIVFKISEQISLGIGQLGHSQDLRALILDAFKKSAGESTQGGPVSVNIPSLLEQAWRTGVWGVMSLLVDWAFLLAEFLIECAREVLVTLILLLFPICAGLYPAFPRLLIGMCLHIVELALWFPMLTAFEVVTAAVARQEMVRNGSWGLYVVAVELLAALLFLSIPAIAHQFVSGAFHGDANGQSGVLGVVKKAISIRRSEKTSQ